MGGFVASKSAVTRHGAFALEKAPPAVVRLIGSGVACLVAQFPWGRDKEVVNPADPKELMMEIAPPGFDHTGSGYLSTIRKAFASFRFVRAVGSTAAKAATTLTAAGPTNIVTVTSKYVGSDGNSIIATVKAASNGNANHFDLDVTISGTSGSTTDVFKNLNVFSGTDVLPTATELNAARLVGSITKLNAGRPVNGNYTFTGGVTGTINSASYVGTALSGDQGLAKAEGSKDIRHVFTDDCGNSLRAAVNAGLQAHAIAMGDRVAFMNGDNSLTLAQTQTDVANYRSTRVMYLDPWVYILDDVDATKRAVPPSAFGAAVASQLPPSTSIAWKSEEVGAMLAGIRGLVADRGDGAGSNTEAGICTVIAEELGGFRFESSNTTNAPVNPSKRTLQRTRVGDAIAVSFTRSVRSLVDAPNVTVTHNSLIGALDTLLGNLKRAQKRDPAHEFFIKDYSPPIVASSDAEIQAGEVEIDTEIKVGAAAEKIFLGIQFGESVVVTAT